MKNKISIRRVWFAPRLAISLSRVLSLVLFFSSCPHPDHTVAARHTHIYNNLQDTPRSCAGAVVSVTVFVLLSVLGVFMALSADNLIVNRAAQTHGSMYHLIQRDVTPLTSG
jgi:hypothetical protein